MFGHSLVLKLVTFCAAEAGGGALPALNGRRVAPALAPVRTRSLEVRT